MKTRHKLHNLLVQSVPGRDSVPFLMVFQDGPNNFGSCLGDTLNCFLGYYNNLIGFNLSIPKFKNLHALAIYNIYPRVCAHAGAFYFFLFPLVSFLFSLVLSLYKIPDLLWFFRNLPKFFREKCFSCLKSVQEKTAISGGSLFNPS